MFVTLAALLGLILACLSLLISLPLLVALRKFKPQISRAMSIMGKLGKEAQMENAEVEDIEQALTDGVLDMVIKKYPEAGLVMAYLEENQPEIMQKIKDNPTIVIALVNKYAPLIGQIMGKGGAKSEVTFDV